MFSIVISVALFIIFNSFMAMSLNVYREINESRNMHFSVIVPGKGEAADKIDEGVIESISRLPYIRRLYKMYDAIYFDAVIGKDKELPDIKDIGGVYKDISYGGEIKTMLGGALVAYDDKAMEAAGKYLKEGSLDIESLNSEIYNTKTERTFYGQVTGLKAGDEILLQPNGAVNGESSNKLGFGEGKVSKVKILLYGFVVVVSLIGGVNIINTLTTNIILRRREFAALKSIGLTEKGLRKVVVLEGILYGIMGSLYGSVIGVFLSYLLYRGIIDVREQSYIFPISSILIASAGAMLIGYLSVPAPVGRMRKDNLVDAVREDF